jgi:hypothetical protein
MAVVLLIAIFTVHIGNGFSSMRPSSDADSAHRCCDRRRLRECTPHGADAPGSAAVAAHQGTLLAACITSRQRDVAPLGSCRRRARRSSSQPPNRNGPRSSVSRDISWSLCQRSTALIRATSWPPSRYGQFEHVADAVFRADNATGADVSLEFFHDGLLAIHASP